MMVNDGHLDLDHHPLPFLSLILHVLFLIAILVFFLEHMVFANT
jgi:hypothetical protein